MIKYKNIPMRFNLVGFAKDFTDEVAALKRDTGGLIVTDEEVAVLIFDDILSASWVSHMRGIARKDESETYDKWISMTRFVTVCNILGLNCRDYFDLDI